MIYLKTKGDCVVNGDMKLPEGWYYTDEWTDVKDTHLYCYLKSNIEKVWIRTDNGDVFKIFFHNNNIPPMKLKTESAKIEFAEGRLVAEQLKIY